MDIRRQMVEHLTRSYYPLAVYTWPCTHYSNIGAIHGAQTGEDLYLHAIRNHALLWPETALVENVLGMHEKFPVVMEILKKYKKYYKTGFVVYGHDFTLQQKARFFMLMHRQPFRFPPRLSTFRGTTIFPSQVTFQRVLGGCCAITWMAQTVILTISRTSRSG